MGQKASGLHGVCNKVLGSSCLELSGLLQLFFFGSFSYRIRPFVCVLGGDSARRAACSDSACFRLETLSSDGPLGGDPAHSRPPS